MKKFEEGIFSDLRNLKPGVDASLEEPKVSFFSFLNGQSQYEGQVGGKRIKKEGGRNKSFIYFIPPPSLPWLPAQNTLQKLRPIPGGKKEKKLCLRHWPSLLLRLLLYPSFYSFSFPLFFLLSSFFSLLREKINN